MLSFRNRYNEYLNENIKSDQKLFATDKMMFNFRFLRFIFDILSEAKIIHCKRDPADIAQYYKLYDDHMNFWVERYLDKIYTVHYEHFVQNADEEIHNLLNFVGLSSNEGCLRFYVHNNSVMTASQLQVKQPLKQSSQNRKKYEFGMTEFFGASGR